MQGVTCSQKYDVQDLEMSKADAKHNRNELTKGLGAGAKMRKWLPRSHWNEIVNYIQGSNMVFIASGMGGGTGTVLRYSQSSKRNSILTVMSLLSLYLWGT